MPPRKKQRGEPTTESSAAIPPPTSTSTPKLHKFTTCEGPRVALSYPPWPKQERQKIKSTRVWEDSPKVEAEKSACINRPISDEWDDYDTLFYNAWLNVPMTPTRLLDIPTLDVLGITDDVLGILKRIGIGSIATTKYILYPDLARQFLSTCRVYYEDESNKVAQEGTLTFICRGLRFRLAITDLCEIYGFDSAPTRVALPEAWEDIDKFWGTIGTGTYRASRSAIKDIRHPAVRCAARVLGTTILCKTDPTRARKEDISLLSSGLCHLYPSEFWESGDPCADLNLGAVFAHHLTRRKTTAFTSRPTESIGSLLTPIFQYLCIDTSNASMVSTDVTMDQNHLRYMQWLKKDRIWLFSDNDASSCLVQLPQPDLTDLQNARFTQLRFDVPRTLAIQTPARIRGQPVHSTADTLPPRMSFPEPPSGYQYDPPAFRHYVVETLRQIWQHLPPVPTGPTAPPPPHSDAAPASTSTPATAHTNPISSEEPDYRSTEEDIPQRPMRTRRSSSRRSGI